MESRFPGRFEHVALPTSVDDACFEVELLTSTGVTVLHSKQNGDGYLDESRLRKILIALDMHLESELLVHPSLVTTSGAAGARANQHEGEDCMEAGEQRPSD